jgi:excisionase family DNA binding protein
MVAQNEDVRSHHRLDSAQSALSVPLLRAADVATMLAVSVKQVYRLAETGVLPSVRFSRKCVRFDAKAVAAFVDAARSSDGLS